MSPENQSKISPFFEVADISAFISFCESLLQADVQHRLLATDKKTIQFAELRIADNLLLVGKSNGPSRYCNQTMVQVADCDASFKKALSLGATSIQPPVMAVHSGEKFAGIKDAWGNIWWLAQQIEEIDCAEQQRRYWESKAKV